MNPVQPAHPPRLRPEPHPAGPVSDRWSSLRDALKRWRRPGVLVRVRAAPTGMIGILHTMRIRDFSGEELEQIARESFMPVIARTATDFRGRRMPAAAGIAPSGRGAPAKAAADSRGGPARRECVLT